MNYIENVLEALRTELPNVPDALLEFYALLVFVKGELTTYKDIHDAWSIWMNASNPIHKSLIPFNELSRETQLLDAKYADAVRKVARELT
jgi:hypothetical protein